MQISELLLHRALDDALKLKFCVLFVPFFLFALVRVSVFAVLCIPEGAASVAKIPESCVEEGSFSNSKAVKNADPYPVQKMALSNISRPGT